MVKALYFILFLSYSVVYSQEVKSYKGDLVLLSTTQTNGGTSYYEYSPALKIKALYKDTIEAINKYPEGLMMSTLSATNQKWVNYNTYGGKAEPKKLSHFDKIKTMNKESNYFELHNKFEYIYNSDTIAIIKFYFFMEGVKKPVVGSTTMKKSNGRWYVTVVPNQMEMSILLMRFKADVLSKIFAGKLTGEQYLDELINKTRNGGNLDFDKLLREYSSWYGETRDQARIDYFIDKNAW